MKKIFISIYKTYQHLLLLFPFKLIRTVKRKGNIDAHKYRYLRARILKKYTTLLSRVVTELEFGQQIIIGPGKEIKIVDNSGIVLSSKGTDRYFKTSKNQHSNEGEHIITFLNDKNLKPANMIDIGANYGEISLCLAKAYPDCRIIAIEASPENYHVFQDNLNSQFFSVDNIDPHNIAVSDHEGTVRIPKGLSSEHSISNDLSSKYHEVKAITLSQLIDQSQLAQIDLIKVDIEGAEPLLLESFKEKIDVIRSLYIEFGPKNEKSKYLEIMSLFMNSGFECYSGDENHDHFLGLQEAEAYFDKHGLVNFWFTK